MKTHFNDEHNLATYSSHSCTNCGKNYSNRIKLFDHLRKSKCGKSLANDSNYIEMENIQETQYSILHDEETETTINENQENFEEKCTLFLEKLMKQWLALLCNFCAHKGMNRKQAFSVFNDSKTELLDPIIEFIAENFVETSNCSIFKDFCDNIQLNYKKINTEYKLIKALKSYNVYSDPIMEEINVTVENIRVGDQLQTIENHLTIAVPNVVFKLKLFLELPGIYQIITNYQKHLSEKNTITNIINGKLWKSITAGHKEKTMIPVLLFYDDFVIDNSISHKTSKTSIAGFYLLFPTLPPEYRSKIENIIMVEVIKSMDIRKYGYRDCLESLIDSFAYMEENGINLKIGNGNDLVFIYLLQIIGDNKGLNEILNFTRTFIGKRHCRLCSEEKSAMKLACIENKAALRTRETYLRDLEAMNEKETGVRGECPLNRLRIFKSYNNYTVDVHHDLLEGDCNFVICNILRFWVDENFITMRRLAKIRKHFIAQSCGRNISDIEILYAHLTNEKLHFNASEMKQFTLYLPLMLDHIIEDKTSDHWKLLLLLVEILEMCLWPEHNQESIGKLPKLVEKHHKLFIKLFRDLRFKQHVMLHYAGAIEEIGPLWNVSAMRGEAKHQALKKVAEATASRRNLPKTIIINDNLALAAKSINAKSFQRIYEHGMSSSLSSEMVSLLKENTMNISINYDEIVEVKHLDIFGITFKKKYIILEEADNLTALFEILNIFIDDQKGIFLCKKLQGFMYDKNIRSYVKNTELVIELPIEYAVLDANSIIYEPSLMIEMPSGKLAAKFFRKLEKK